VGDSDGDAVARIHPGILYSRAKHRRSTAIQPVYMNGKHSISVVILVDVWHRLKLLTFPFRSHMLLSLADSSDVEQLLRPDKSQVMITLQLPSGPVEVSVFNGQSSFSLFAAEKSVTTQSLVLAYPSM
jgi:hypothetical protein